MPKLRFSECGRSYSPKQWLNGSLGSLYTSTALNLEFIPGKTDESVFEDTSIIFHIHQLMKIAITVVQWRVVGRSELCFPDLNPIFLIYSRSSFRWSGSMLGRGVSTSVSCNIVRPIANSLYNCTLKLRNSMAVPLSYIFSLGSCWECGVRFFKNIWIYINVWVPSMNYVSCWFLLVFFLLLIFLKIFISGYSWMSSKTTRKG